MNFLQYFDSIKTAMNKSQYLPERLKSLVYYLLRLLNLCLQCLARFRWSMISLTCGFYNVKNKSKEEITRTCCMKQNIKHQS